MQITAAIRADGVVDAGAEVVAPPAVAEVVAGVTAAGLGEDLEDDALVASGDLA